MGKAEELEKRSAFPTSVTPVTETPPKRNPSYRQGPSHSVYCR